MKIKEREQFFVMDGECDRKNKLLRSNTRLTEEEVRRLDSGKLSLEDLDILLAKKAKIFKYRTQITVHADFPSEVGSRVNGYAFLVNNKNGSVGIRYGAIDESKRQKLARYLSYEGFRYDKNSTKHDFVISKSFCKREEANAYIGELKTRYDYSALRKLIYGRIDIYGGIVWGRYYVELSITVNAIPKKNIAEFLKLLGCKSDAEIAGIEAKKEEERRQRDEQWARERREREAKELSEAKTKRDALLAEYRQKYTQVNTMPDGICSLCIITNRARQIVVKQFFQKSGRKIIRKFLQVDQIGRSQIDYELWNDVMPPESVKNSAKIEKDALLKYIQEGVVFMK